MCQYQDIGLDPSPDFRLSKNIEMPSLAKSTYRSSGKATQFRIKAVLDAAWNNANLPVRAICLLWVFVPVALTLAWARRDLHREIFAFSYIAIIPCASTLDLAGQDMALKLPRVLGITLETLLGTLVELVLFIMIISLPIANGSNITVLKAAILGSILANMLLALGICFLIGGLKYEEQKFHSAIGQSSSDVLLGAGFALLLPALFFSSLYSSATSIDTNYTMQKLSDDSLAFSRGVAIILLTSFFVHLYHNVSTHRSVLDETLQQEEEDEPKERLTALEAAVTAVFSLACVCVLAYVLVREIHPIVHSSSVTENFMGLILVPLVEKLSEHTSVVNKILKNQPNMAIYHCIGPSISTVLFNAPVVVLLGWALKEPMNLNFEVFQLACLLLSVVVVIIFLNKGSSSYLKGYILLIIYLALAVGAWYYPSITVSSENQGQQSN